MNVRLIYCFPSITLYLFVLVALFKELKASTGHFYPLLITQAILNVLVFTNSFYAYQLAACIDSKSWLSVLYTKTPIVMSTICYCPGHPSFLVSPAAGATQLGNVSHVIHFLQIMVCILLFGLLTPP
ncbi:hypothetical protein Y032_0425g1231 [Ancylostoma ceylanicum]|uniref:Serpentine receptor class gamma n=1 Tax=Ancylostoma ceylanicum TaxID=53326 RepID=A0A016X0R9_9BILA|nr:hypothetical protein Y032_0425g1231 [Ancylostoma ceylanicum]